MAKNKSKKFALLSLNGLSVGDAIGEHWLRNYSRFTWDAEIPGWGLQWTDDTHMALSIVEVLCQAGEIDQDTLAKRFAQRYVEDPYRGYSGDTQKFLTKLGQGGDWRTLTRARFSHGSYGNGSAMRAAPIGGYFSGNPEKAAEQANLSSEITHAHPEGVAGAIAGAVAAAVVSPEKDLSGNEFIQEVLRYLPASEVADRIRHSLALPKDRLLMVAKELGTGYKVSAQDTVPFCIWISAHYGDDFEGALRVTMQGMGDCDTTCAIVGGIVSLKVGEVPVHLLNSREPLPELDLGN